MSSMLTVIKSFFFDTEVSPTKQNNSKQKKKPRKRSPKWERDRVDPHSRPFQDKFIRIFGFKPHLIDEDRYKKEILLKLGFMAVKLKKEIEIARLYKSIDHSEYDECSRKYSAMLELIKRFDPKFEAEIPHWTELPQFIDGWIKGMRYQSPKVKSVVECPPHS